MRWVKATEVLRPGGFLALVGNHPIARGTFHDFHEATRALRVGARVDDERATLSPEDLRAVVASNGDDVGAPWEALSPQGTDIVAGDLFTAPDVRGYPWSASYATREALGLLTIYSRYVAMDPARRASLFTRLAAVIDEHYDGELTRHYVSVLATARRARR